MDDLELEAIGPAEVDRVVVSEPGRELSRTIEEFRAGLAHQPTHRVALHMALDFESDVVKTGLAGLRGMTAKGGRCPLQALGPRSIDLGS